MTYDELERRLREALLARADVRFALVFGSVVSRGPDAARDVDVAVSLHTQLSLMDLGRLAVELERTVGKDVDVIDLDEATTLLRWEIVRTGRVVVAPDGDALLEFKALVPREYADLEPYLLREAEGLRRALKVG